MKQSKPTTIKLNTFTVEVTRKQMKSIRLRVLSDGQVRLSVPFSLSDREIEAFLAPRLDWIKAQHSRLAAAPEQSGLPLTPADRAALKEAIASRLPLWEARTGLRCASWQIRDMRSRWGSCTPKKKTIRFALQLARQPEECLDYVILHELCHLAVPNHGPAFKALLDRHMPDWQQRRRLLRGQ